MQITDLLKQTDKLPNVPDVVLDLIESLGNPKVKHSDIAKKVAHDQTISMKVLRVVNSAYFGLSRKVFSIDDAIVLLGLDKLKTLVIASGFVNSVDNVKGIDLHVFWHDSFCVAELAQWLGKRTALVDADEAFTAGIVHNIGRLLLHLTEPTLAEEIHQRVVKNKESRVRVEKEVLTFTTQDASKALMDMWHFPPELGIAVQKHKRPFGEAQPQPHPLACILNLACYLNACISEERSLPLVQEGFPLAVAKGAGLKESVVDELEQALNLDSGLKQILN